jgi:transcriptional regulator with XRE-family HTH domain
MNLKELILASRIARQWTQMELSDRAKVSLRTIKRLESGGSADLDEITRLLMVLNHKAYTRLSNALSFQASDFFEDPVQQITFVETYTMTRRVRKKVNK